jgi:hypothetical protein
MNLEANQYSSVQHNLILLKYDYMFQSKKTTTRIILQKTLK